MRVTTLLGKRLLRISQVPVGLAIFLLGCDMPPPAADRAELLNIRPSMIVPKTPPDRLVRSFQKYCLTGSLARSRAALIADDYVETTSITGTGGSFAVDGLGPFVMSTEIGCGVSASARTGQSNAVTAFLSALEGAQPLPDPRRVAPNAELAYLLTQPQKGLVSLTRQRITARETQIILAFIPMEGMPE